MALRPGISGVLILAAFAVTGCAEFSEFISFGDEEERKAARAEAERANLWEMTISAGRYGVMLGQAREILNLPEPKDPTGDVFPGGETDLKAQRAALSAYQVQVANEFLSDAARACKTRKVPVKLRALACQQQKKVPGELRSPAEAEMVALSMRNMQVGEVVMPWWSAVCATAPKPGRSEPGACAIE